MAYGSLAALDSTYCTYSNSETGERGGYFFYVTWEAIADRETNSSNITFTFSRKFHEKGYLQRSGELISDGNPTITLTVDGRSYNLQAYPDEGALTSSRISFPVAYGGSKSNSFTVNVPHNSDGSGSCSASATMYFKDECEYLAGIQKYSDGSSLIVEDRFSEFLFDHSFEADITLDTIFKEPSLLTATNFTDEENPVITYSNPGGNNVSLLQAAISLTGATDDIAYRDVSKTGSSYTFTLTDDERNLLRKAAIDKQTMPVRFYLKSVVDGTTYWNYLERNFTVVNCSPVITNPVVKNAISDVSDLTGDENILVRHVSMIEYSFEASTSKFATIAEQYIQCGNKKITGLSQGVIDDIESGTFIFGVTDSRGLTTTRTIERDIVEYVKPTCNQTVKAELVGETGAQIALTVSGNYFNDTFGAVENTLKLEVRHTQNDGTMGDWVELTDGLIPVFNGNTYTLDITISGFDYAQAYTFQCRATDKLNVVETASYTVRALPVFDWGEEDFNFNVPVNVNASTFNMNGETILRHTGSSTNNTVLSASGGHIYIRPGGTSDTSSEVRITAQGDIEVKGDIIINGVSLTTILQNAGLM